MLVGAAPAGGRVWLRRSEAWQDFKLLLSAILNHATIPKKILNRFAALAQAVESTADVSNAYGIAVIPEELLSEDAIPEPIRERARRWAFDAIYEVEALNELSLRVRPILLGRPIGTVELMVTVDEGEASIKTTWSEPEPDLAKEREECDSFLCDPSRIKIFYESGHTISQGRCYSGGYTDQPFAWDFRSFAGFDIKKEKPPVPKKSTLAAQIGGAGDNSLFAYVCKRMFLGDDGTPKGWLASDDGSMELADFIHIDSEKKIVSLIHVKGSSKGEPDRLAAPTDYEVVVSQAVKNLRYLDRRKLIDELRRGKGKKIGAAVWHDGIKQPNRDGFLAAAQRLPQSANKALIVLQPRVTSRERDRCLIPGAPQSHALRIKQIDTLLLAARASALACGATFETIGDSD